MSDTGPTDGHIVPLAGRRALSKGAPSSSVEEFGARSTQEEIQWLLGPEDGSVSEPAPASEWLTATQQHEYRGPPPHHANAEVCPQCDYWTWRHSELCVHCGFNLFDYFDEIAFEQAQEQRRIERERILLFLLVLVVGSIGAVALSRVTGSPFSQWLLFGGLGGLFAAAMIGKEIPPSL